MWILDATRLPDPRCRNVFATDYRLHRACRVRLGDQTRRVHLAAGTRGSHAASWGGDCPRSPWPSAGESGGSPQGCLSPSAASRCHGGPVIQPRNTPKRDGTPRVSRRGCGLARCVVNQKRSLLLRRSCPRQSIPSSWDPTATGAATWAEGEGARAAWEPRMCRAPLGSAGTADPR